MRNDFFRKLVIVSVILFLGAFAYRSCGSIARTSGGISSINYTSNKGGSGRGNADNFNTYYIPEQQNTQDTYVLNTSTHKFHRPSCKEVKKIAPKNYATSSEGRNTIISQGYSPCKKCNP